MKKVFAFVFAGMLVLSLTACGKGPSPSGNGSDMSQEGSDTSQEDSDASREGSDTSPEDSDMSQEDSDASQEDSDASQENPDTSQGEPEEIDLDKMAEEYSNDTEVKDRLSGKNVRVTGYIKLDRDTDELYLWGWCYHNNSSSINIVVKLSEEDEALMRSEEFFLARVTLTGRIDEGMREEKTETSETANYWYTMSEASYVTNICQVTGILNLRDDGRYWMEEVGDIRFLDKENIPPVGTEVTLSGKISYGGDFREAVVVE